MIYHFSKQMKVDIVVILKIVRLTKLLNSKIFRTSWLTVAVIPVFITGCPVITKWGDNGTFVIMYYSC